jgi:hypothetical protein
VFVMDWTVMGANPPIFTLPTVIRRVFLRFMGKGIITNSKIKLYNL